MVKDFADFLDKCFMLDPDKRITPQDALRHPFLAMNSWIVCWRNMGVGLFGGWNDNDSSLQ